MDCNLKANRCPNAQLTLNQILDKFMISGLAELNVLSIEPSLERSLRQRIAHLELPICIDETIEEIAISTEHVSAWAEEFDEEDYEDVSVIRVFKITAIEI